MSKKAERQAETESSALAPRNQTQEKIARIRDLFRRAEPQIAAALPRQLDSERFLRILMTSVQLTPKLLDAKPVSLLAAAMQAAQLGLEPDPRLGLVYLLPFGETVQVLLGYRGIITLARNSDQIATIEARAVYEHDVFEWEYGLTQRLRHVPSEQQNPGKLRAAYALVRFKGTSEALFNVVLPRDVEAARKFSRRGAGPDSPWVLHRAAMWAKTAVRRMEPFLPLTAQARYAFALDDQAERGESQVFDAGALDLTAFVDEEEQAEDSTLDALAKSLENGQNGRPEAP